MQNNVVVQGSYNQDQWDEFLAFLSINKNQAYYKQLIQEFMDITKKNPLSCTYDDIIFWWDNQSKNIREINGKLKKFEFTTSNVKLAKMSVFYEIAMERGLINFNPIKNLIKHKTIRRVAGEKQIQIRVTEPMVRKIISSENAIPPYLRVAMLIFLNTGVRISELLKMRYSDIALLMDDKGDAYYQISVVGKGTKYVGKKITVQAYQQIISLIKGNYTETMQKSVYLIPRWDGGAMTRQNFDNVIKNAWELEFGNRNISAHDFKHLAVTVVYEKTKDIFKTQEFAGHASVTTTQRYSHIHLKASEVEFISDALPCDEEMTDPELESMFNDT